MMCDVTGPHSWWSKWMCISQAVTSTHLLSSRRKMQAVVHCTVLGCIHCATVYLPATSLSQISCDCRSVWHNFDSKWRHIICIFRMTIHVKVIVVVFLPLSPWLISKHRFFVSRTIRNRCRLRNYFFFRKEINRGNVFSICLMKCWIFRKEYLCYVNTVQKDPLQWIFKPESITDNQTQKSLQSGTAEPRTYFMVQESRKSLPKYDSCAVFYMASMNSRSPWELESYTFSLWGTSLMHALFTHRGPKTSANYANMKGRSSKLYLNSELFMLSPRLYPISDICVIQNGTFLAVGRVCACRVTCSIRESFLLNKGGKFAFNVHFITRCMEQRQGENEQSSSTNHLRMSQTT